MIKLKFKKSKKGKILKYEKIKIKFILLTYIFIFYFLQYNNFLRLSIRSNLLKFKMMIRYNITPYIHKIH